MANQKITELRRMTVGQVAPGDLIGVVDVSEPTTPTGENKAISAMEFAKYVAQAGYGIPPVPAAAPSNGLAMDGTYIVPVGAGFESFCQGTVPAVGSGQLSLCVRAYFPSAHPPAYNTGFHRVIAGVGLSPDSIALSANSFYLAADGDDLVGRFCSSTGQIATLTLGNFFSTTGYDKALHIILTRVVYPTHHLKIWINGVEYPTAVQTGTVSGTITNSYVVVGNGTTGLNNIDATIYEVAIKQISTTTSAQALKSFFSGESPSDPYLLGRWVGENLCTEPGQWLDSSGHNNHMLLPVEGAKATSPRKTFSLRFATDTDGYLGGDRPVLPENYVLTSCIVESPGKPLLSIGSSGTASYSGASITGSWYDNRVAMVSASYGVNPLTVNTLGDVHLERKLYVKFYESNVAPCTFSFEGYTR